MSRAATLDCLEAAGYPAPRVVRTRPGDPVGTDGMWLTLATTLVEGPVIRPSLAQLRMLGMALGRLHALDVAGGAVEGGSRDVAGAVPGRGGEGRAGRASWYPEAAIPATLARLDAVGALVPDDWHSLYAQFGRTARAVQQSLGELPRGVVHGDAWPGNAVQTGPGSVTLIDWETSGLGLPVLDLGHCLIESLLDAQPSADGPAAWLVEPDEDRVGAVAAGYASQRRLGEAELALLPEAVRFGACYVGAIHLYRALAEGVSGTSMDARLERLRNRVAVSEAVARLAAPHLTDGAETIR
jgi:Ser/Thr protein kinase RdoA (MazF antagonist)